MVFFSIFQLTHGVVVWQQMTRGSLSALKYIQTLLSVFQWSYGIVLWELMTRGVTPYPEVGNWEIIKFLKPGRRMPQPAYCPDSL